MVINGDDNYDASIMIILIKVTLLLLNYDVLSSYLIPVNPMQFHQNEHHQEINFQKMHLEERLVHTNTIKVLYKIKSAGEWKLKKT